MTPWSFCFVYSHWKINLMSNPDTAGWSSSESVEPLFLHTSLVSFLKRDSGLVEAKPACCPWFYSELSK